MTSHYTVMSLIVNSNYSVRLKDAAQVKDNKGGMEEEEKMLAH